MIKDSKELKIFNDELLDDLSEEYEEDNNLVTKDALRAYFKSLKRFPLLNASEESHYGMMLKNPEDKKLLILKEIDSYDIWDLNVSLLFNSLCNHSLYNDVISDLINFYNSLEGNNKQIYEMLQRYKSEYTKINRSLNSVELKTIFNIESIDNVLNEKDLLIEVKKFMNYKYAFDKMFVSNLRLVASIARNYGYRFDMMDLINEGNLGLMKAIGHFDVSLGNRFSTYASYWIKMSIRRAILSQKSSIRIPEHKYNSINRFKKELSILEQQEKRTLTEDEIADKLPYTIEKVREYRKYMQDVLSLDATISEDDSTTMQDVIPSDVNVENMALRDSLKFDVETLYEALTEREQMVIKMRFGTGELKGCKYSYEYIAKKLGVSKQRVGDIERRALYKMKRYTIYNFKARALKEYIYR